MRFILVDRIVELEPDAHIVTVKNLTMAEEYLSDHFPAFPVMPGVLMLEAMTQAGAWLVRHSDDFAHSMVVLKQATNIKYGQFIEPGQTLSVTAEMLSNTKDEASLKASGSVNGRMTVSGRLILSKYNLADTNPRHARIDQATKNELRRMFDLLYQPCEAVSGTTTA